MMNKFYTRTAALAVGIALIVSALPARASHEEVLVDSFVLSTCGQQGIPFSGIAIGHGGQVLIVTLDGREIDVNLNGILWTSGFVTVGVGNHTIVAEIRSGLTVTTSHQFNFSVIACPTPTSSDNGGGNGGGGGGGEEPQSTPAKKGTVKGTSIRKKGDIPNKLVPAVIARLFKEVFGRDITPRESTYWKKRARTDKPFEVSLKNAMLWHKLHGRTIGK